MSFESLGLSHNIIRSVKKLGYLKPFPIQEQAVPVILQGKDLMGIAQTGSGKTACFVMPILEKLQNTDVKKDRNVQVLILVPTRELAIQIDEVFRAFTENLKREVRTMAVYGGVSINPQMKGMFGVEVLIATPGRLLDLIDHNALSISGIKHLVIDEADKMFQLGFGEEMNKLFAMMPVAKQTTLFSATLNDKVSEMKERLSINPTIIEIKKEEVERGQVLCKPGTIKPHTEFKCEVYILSKEEGGRHTPFFSGYRPQFYVRTTDVTGSCVLNEGTEMVIPGDNVEMTVTLVAPIALEKGTKFAIREGGRTVGAGVISEIIK